MWLVVSTPSFNVPDLVVRVARLYVEEGARLLKGQTLLDLTVDLSAGFARDCPPISTSRVILREDAWLRRLPVSAGAEVAPGAPLALLSSDPDEPVAEAAREARLTVATVLHHDDWWTSTT